MTVRPGLALIAVLMADLARAGCGGPSSPNGSPSPTAPVARPNSTALENLPLIRRLEEASGRRSILILVRGLATLDGRVDPGASWGYQFAEIQGNSVRLNEWGVLPTGQIRAQGDVLDITGRLGLDNAVEIGASLAVDTPDAIRRGRDNGAEEFVRRYPQTVVSVFYGSQSGQPVCRLTFRNEPVVRCGIFIVLDPRTGELLERNLSCYDELPPP